MAVIFVRHVPVPAPYGEQRGHVRLIFMRVPPGGESRWAMCRTEFSTAGGFKRRRWMLSRSVNPVSWSTWPSETVESRLALPSHGNVRVALPPPPSFKPETFLKVWDKRTQSWRLL